MGAARARPVAEGCMDGLRCNSAVAVRPYRLPQPAPPCLSIRLSSCLASVQGDKARREGHAPRGRTHISIPDGGPGVSHSSTSKTGRKPCRDVTQYSKAPKLVSTLWSPGEDDAALREALPGNPRRSLVRPSFLAISGYLCATSFGTVAGHRPLTAALTTTTATSYCTSTTGFGASDFHPGPRYWANRGAPVSAAKRESPRRLPPICLCHSPRWSE
ncbi:hypothetical protein GGR56DRAFT_549080 [Xylariaceae sp. FL0804]|nr:hypothetical protein GGR56DRAFT_549080 [Xylariaceae sp. FL0804]